MSKSIVNAELEGLNELESVDTMEAELEEAVAAPKKAKTPKAPKTPKEPKIGENQIGVAILAETLGTTGRELRMFLRKHFRDMANEKGKTYVWDKDSPEVQNIIDTYKAKKAEPRKKAEKVEKAEPAMALEADLDGLDLDEVE